MHKLQPLELKATGESSYVVRFQFETGEVEFNFHIDNSAGFDLLVSDREFLEITNGDPAADALKEAICNFHEARRFVSGEPGDSGNR